MPFYQNNHDRQPVNKRLICNSQIQIQGGGYPANPLSRTSPRFRCIFPMQFQILLSFSSVQHSYDILQPMENLNEWKKDVISNYRIIKLNHCLCFRQNHITLDTLIKDTKAFHGNISRESKFNLLVWYCFISQFTKCF